jgi:hypothetical protein
MAMVWKLRDWQDGDPTKQAAQAVNLGLSTVSIKILDGTRLRWEGNRTDQNADLLPGTIEALQSAGINVVGWLWTYGAKWVLNNGSWVLGYSESAAVAEAVAGADAMALYGLDHVQLDCENDWQKSGADKRAAAYGQAWAQHGPQYTQGLCSYRFPLTYQPSFPVRIFAPFVESFCPQVYFLGDNREQGGAIQLETSFNQYRSVRDIPFIPIAPTYGAVVGGNPWTASGAQLTAFFAKAKSMGCPGAGVWDLPQANADQLAAIRDFVWTPPEQPPTHDETPKAIRDEADLLKASADRLDAIADSIDNGS